MKYCWYKRYHSALTKFAFYLNIYKPSVPPFVGQTLNREANNEDDPDETPQYAASDQEIHWLVTKYSIKNSLN